MKMFENAYFGKAYKTRDGRKLILEAIFPDEDKALLISESKITNNCFRNDLHIYRLDGINRDCPELDIVSEWQEPINEEKLDKDFAEFVNSDEFRSSDTPYFYFKAGYCKAKKGGEE